jgi:hypothetical protein
MLKPRISVLLICSAFSAAALAADKGAATAAREVYQQERAACMNLSGDDRKTCLREAGAAQVETRRGTLAVGGDFQQNLLARCEVHKNAEDKSYCERRMRGEGTQTGSVEGGGILRELTVTVPVEETPGSSGYGSDSFSKQPADTSGPASGPSSVPIPSSK